MNFIFRSALLVVFPFLFLNRFSFRFNVDAFCTTKECSADLYELWTKQQIGCYKLHHVCVFTWAILFSDSSQGNVHL